ncbi:MAG: hypothetical protein AB2L12_13510 [Smithellaceae bacterium]
MDSTKKLVHFCDDCVIIDCRFKESDYRFELNCPADPRAHIYEGRKKTSIGDDVQSKKYFNISENLS